MAGFVVKLVVCPIAVILASLLLPNVGFAFWYQPIIIGVVIAAVGYFMEVLMLKESTNWLTTLLDFVVASAIVYFGAALYAGSFATFWGAILTGALIGVTEIFQHSWLLHSGRAQKDPVSD